MESTVCIQCGGTNSLDSLNERFRLLERRVDDLTAANRRLAVACYVSSILAFLLCLGLAVR